jgi:hypothetical protein
VSATGRALLATVAAAGLAAGAAAARPIRTNTPGTGVFIGSGVLGQAICEERSGGGVEVGSCMLVADFRYTPATDWVFGLRAPLYLERAVESDGREVSGQGPGDVEVSGKWRFFRQVGMWFDRHAAVEVGVSLPTGEREVPSGSGLPPALAARASPGTGATAGFVDLVYQQGQRRVVWGGDLLYRRSGEGLAGRRAGDLVRLTLDAEYILFPRVYTRPGNEVFVLLETTLAHRQGDELEGRRLANGGSELLLAPGIQRVATEQLLFSLSVQLPVWSDLDPGALATDWNVLAEFRYAF